METEPGRINSSEQETTDNFWMKVAGWWKRTPILKHLSPPGTIAALLGILMAIIFPQGHCTCEDQIDDPKLKKLALAGDKNVRNYQQQLDNIYICAAKRAELLKQLEMQKKRQQDSLKRKPPTPKT